MMAKMKHDDVATLATKIETMLSNIFKFSTIVKEEKDNTLAKQQKLLEQMMNTNIKLNKELKQNSSTKRTLE